MRRSAVGASVERLDADRKVSGEHLYPSDIQIPDALWLEPVRAGIAHARIVSIETSRASAFPGVVRVFTAADVPGLNAFGLIVADQPVMSSTLVRSAGDVVALVAAETPQAALAAASLVDVSYDVLPNIDDPLLALAAETPKLHDGGNLCASLSFKTEGWPQGTRPAARYVAEYSYRTGRQSHAFLETEAGASWIDDWGRLNISAGGQNPFMDRRQVCAALNLPADRVRVLNPMMGGAFGGKEDISVQILLGLVTLATGRPARWMLRREDSLAYGVKRHPFQIAMAAGMDGDGRFRFLDVDMIADTGAYTTLGPAVIGLAIEHCSGPYVFPSSRVEAKAVYTTNGNSSAFRGFGNPQVTTGIEQIVDILARKSGFDPMHLRRINAAKAGDRGVIQQTFAHTVPLPALLDQSVNGPLYRDQVAWKAQAGEDHVRGVGIAACWQGFGLGPGAEPGATVEVGLLDAGDYFVAVGCPDMGEGNLTAFAQIAADTLACNIESVRMRMADTDGPDSHSSNSSRTVTVVGTAVAKACSRLIQDIAARLAVSHGGEVAHSSRGFTANGEPLDASDLARLVGPLSLTHFHMPTLPPSAAEGIPHLSYTPAVLVLGLDVNLLTGETEPLRIEVYVDPGKVVNPAGVQAQIEGAVAQGLGFALMEDAVMSDGKVVNHRFANYIIPSIRDVPVELLTFISSTPDPTNLLGVRGVAEIGITPVAAAVANALADAVGVRFNKFPIAPEDILDALDHGFEKAVFA